MNPLSWVNRSKDDEVFKNELRKDFEDLSRDKEPIVMKWMREIMYKMKHHRIHKMNIEKLNEWNSMKNKI
jgi:hypothetical protein